ncbi:MAG: hypothetical protein HY862_18865 [Chloroflexi bacterium]|nr:hypothetical protein [Chloroflexota bacterium]
MPNIPNALYTLQTYELAVDHARTRLAAIEAALTGDEDLKSAQAAHEISEAAVQQCQTTIKNLEEDLKRLQLKIAEVDELLYGGSIRNPKELQERQDEVNSLRNRATDIESHIQELMADLENLRATHRTHQEVLTAAISQRDKNHAELIIEQDQLNTQVKNNLRKRKTILEEVPETIYKQYQVLRKKKHGQAVALMQNSQCNACGIEQTWAHAQHVHENDELVYCEGCGRILVSR